MDRYAPSRDERYSSAEPRGECGDERKYDAGMKSTETAVYILARSQEPDV